VKKLQKDLSNAFTEMYLTTVPTEILKMFEKHPSFFEQRCEFQLQGNGCNYPYVRANRALPFSKRVYTPTEEQAVKLLACINKIDSKKKELNKLINDIAITLVALRTYKKIKEVFPEAALFLPEKTTTALALNISDLQGRLK
jgi:hypothetical protein